MSEPIVFLPDILCDAQVFAPQTAQLSIAHPVMVAPVTQADRIETIASTLLPALPARFALVGLGLGGQVALDVLRRARSRVTRIALISTTPLAETPQDSAAREPRIVHARAGRLQEAIHQELPADRLAPSADRPALIQFVTEMAMGMGPDVFIRQSRALQRRSDQQAALRRIHQPALVLGGAFDSHLPPKRHGFTAEFIPHAELRIIEDAGRLPTLESPAATTAALQEWLARPYVLR